MLLFSLHPAWTLFEGKKKKKKSLVHEVQHFSLSLNETGACFALLSVCECLGTSSHALDATTVQTSTKIYSKLSGIS